MRTIQKLFLLATLTLLVPISAWSQSMNDMRAMSQEDRRAFMESMSEDERSAMQEKWRGEFDALPEDEKQAIRKRRADQGGGRDRDAMRERWDSMSDEERATASGKRGDRQHGKRQKGGRQHGKRQQSDRQHSDRPES